MSILPVKELLKEAIGCSQADFPSLVQRIKSTSMELFEQLLLEKPFLLKTLSICPESALIHSTMVGNESIYECVCPDLSRHVNSLRKTLVDELTLLAGQHFASVDTFTIVSLASGGAFQELVIHAALVSKFDKPIHWVLADPLYKESENKTMRAFEKLLKLLSEKSTVEVMDSDTEVVDQLNKRADLRPHIFISIDSGFPKMVRLEDGSLDSISPQQSSLLDVFKQNVQKLHFPHIFAILDPESVKELALPSYQELQFFS